jgi:hypothetical protein
VADASVTGSGSGDANVTGGVQADEAEAQASAVVAAQ